MGVYDTFGKQRVQLKLGYYNLNHYEVGDKVELYDGVYIGYEGAVVISNGKLIGVFSNVQDKWGNLISIDGNNPVGQVVDALTKEEKKC